MKTIAFATAPAITLASCTTVKVNRSSANSAKYRSYAFMEPDVKAGRNPLYYNDIATQNAEAVVGNTLPEKRLQKNEDNPDLLVGYHFFVQQKNRTVTDPPPFYGSYRRNWCGEVPSKTPSQAPPILLSDFRKK